MALLLRRLIVSMLIPYLWRRWRQRSSSTRETPPTTALHGRPQPRTGAGDVASGLVASAEY
jgi:hypothetical protein